jgi:L-ribulose-5-phosphate 3-epimerase
MNRLKLGIHLESLGLPLRRALAEASKMGVPGIQIDAIGDLSPENLSQTGRREFRHLLRSHNLEVSAVGCPLRRGLDAEQGLQPRLEHIRNVLRLSYDLGPRLVIVQAGKVPDPAETKPAAVEKSPGGLVLATPETLPFALSGGIDLSATVESIRERKKGQVMTDVLRDLAAFGDHTGTTLALETGLEAGTTLAAFLDQFDSGALKVNFDPANLLLNGFDPFESLRALNRHVVHIHAHDARQSSASRAAQEVPVGHGDIDWMMFVALLEEIEYHGYLTVEREGGDNRLADVSNGVDFLRRLIGST